MTLPTNHHGCHVYKPSLGLVVLAGNTCIFFQQYFSSNLAVSLIGGGNKEYLEKTTDLSLTNFIT
jgi:hypothetical protein